MCTHNKRKTIDFHWISLLPNQVVFLSNSKLLLGVESCLIPVLYTPKGKERDHFEWMDESLSSLNVISAGSLGQVLAQLLTTRWSMVLFIGLDS
jgi:hypothetical protein